MSLEDALLTHFEWKLTFRTAILQQEKLDATQIADTCGCDFGHWLEHEGRINCGHFPGYAQLVENHRLFHLEAGRVAELINAGRYQEAEEAIAVGPSEYSRLSSAVGSGIAELRKLLAQQVC